MAEEVAAPKAPEVVVPEAEKVEVPSEAKPEATPEPEAEKEKPAEEVAEKDEKKITQQVSFKEETNVVSELPEAQSKALDELKKLVQEALNKHEFSKKKTEEVAPKTEEVTPKTEEPTPKTEEVTPETEESTPKTEEPAATPETEATPKTEEPAPVPAPAPEAEAPKTEETPIEVLEKTVEAIKETIVEVVAPAATEEEPIPTQAIAPEPEPEPIEPEEVSIWGIPLLADDRSDVILLKFLRARDFKVKEAFTMIKNTVAWRKEFEVDALLEEDLGSDYEKVVFTHGSDKQGRLVCYNVFGEFQNKELYQNTFSDAEKRKKFLRWLIQFLEKTIRTLDFTPKGINSFVLVNDLKNSPGYGKREISKVIDSFFEILQDNYPEFVAKQLCINVSWWYLAYNWIYLTVFSPRSKSKFVFASPSKTADTLFKYISPEQVPVYYGGHSKVEESEFTPADPVTEVTLKPGSTHPIEFSFTEAAELVWELRVIGWEVNYGAEFTPAKEGGYSLNIAKTKKVSPTDEPVIFDSFKVTEEGKVVLTIENTSTKKKKLLYRSKVRASE